jgi:uncharacterized membrane protein
MTPQNPYGQQNPYQQPSFDPSGGTSGPGPLGLDPKMAAMLCYTPLCAINLIMSVICLATGGENRFVKFHAKQSLFLAVIVVVLSVVVQIISLILGQIGGVAAVLGFVISLAFLLVVLVFVGLSIFLMIKAFGGDKLKLPVIGDLADK